MRSSSKRGREEILSAAIFRGLDTSPGPEAHFGADGWGESGRGLIMGQSDHIRMEGKCCHLASLFPLVQPRGKPRSERCGLLRSKRASRISPHAVMTIETSSHYVRFHHDICGCFAAPYESVSGTFRTWPDSRLESAICL
jgi:hypothetical protein